MWKKKVFPTYFVRLSPLRLREDFLLDVKLDGATDAEYAVALFLFGESLEGLEDKLIFFVDEVVLSIVIDLFAPLSQHYVLFFWEAGKDLFPWLWSGIGRASQNRCIMWEGDRPETNLPVA